MGGDATIYLMSDWFLHTGLYLLGVLLVPAVGSVLICWGLWGDRSKGRARCPKCWYDMRGSLPKLECPECGHDVEHERQLYRNRRHWWPLFLGIVLVLLLSYPMMIVCGWYREQLVIRDMEVLITRVPVQPTWWPPKRYGRWFDRVWIAILPRSGTDADVAECAKLWHLQKLYLAGTQITDAGLVHLKGMSQLQYLTLHDTQVTDEGLAHLTRLSRLQHLDLSGTQVTDVGLVHLKGLSQLHRLFLADTTVTDSGLEHLKGMSNLRLIDVGNTRVTESGLTELEQALPDVEFREW